MLQWVSFFMEKNQNSLWLKFQLKSSWNNSVNSCAMFSSSLQASKPCDLILLLIKHWSSITIRWIIFGRLDHTDNETYFSLNLNIVSSTLHSECFWIKKAHRQTTYRLIRNSCWSLSKDNLLLCFKKSYFQNGKLLTFSTHFNEKWHCS